MAPCVPRRVVLRATVAAGLGGLTGALARCAAAPRSGSIVAYISADDVLAREVLAACVAATGVEIEPVFDTEATKTTGLERRLLSERNRPRADLFWSSEGFAVLSLARAGATRALPTALVEAWPEAHRDRDGHWLAFAARARVVVTRTSHASGKPFDRSELEARDIGSWADLARPGLARGTSASIAIADPRFGTTCCHLAALKHAWRVARARGTEVPTLDAWLDGLRTNGVRVLVGGNSATVEAVATGECAFGLTDTDDALAAIARGLPLRMVLPRTLPRGERGGGTMLVPNTVCAVANGPGDPMLADRVAAFLVSPACERLIAQSASRNLALGPRVDAVSAFSEPDPMVFDIEAAATDAHHGAAAHLKRLEGDA